VNADELEELLMELLRGIQETIQSGEVLSDEFQGQLAIALNDMTETIDELRAQESGREPPIETQAPIPVGVDLLWILAGGHPDAFVNYLRTYPDAALNALLRNPTRLQEIIDQLERTLPQGERGQQDGIPQAPIESSNIYGFQYDPKSGNLKVRFQSGSVYGYTGVPAGVFNVFQQGAVPARTDGQNEHGRWWQGKMPSLGAAFYSLIRQGNYPYQQLQ